MFFLFHVNFGASHVLRLYIFNVIPQQRKLMGSSAQISSGVCRCGSQHQVPERGSGRFRKVPEGSGVCWCRFQRQVPEGSGEFRRAPESSGEFWRWCRFWRQVPEGSGRFRRVAASSGEFRCVQGSEGSREFRCGNLDRSSHVIVVNNGWSSHCPHGWNHCAKKVHVVKYKASYYVYTIYIYIYDTAVGDATKAFFFGVYLMPRLWETTLHLFVQMASSGKSPDLISLSAVVEACVRASKKKQAVKFQQLWSQRCQRSTMGEIWRLARNRTGADSSFSGTKGIWGEAKKTTGRDI